MLKRYSLKNQIFCTYQYHSHQSLTLLFHLTRLGRLDEVVGTRIDWRPVELRLETGRRGQQRVDFLLSLNLETQEDQFEIGNVDIFTNGLTPNLRFNLHPTHLIHFGLGMSNCFLVVSPSMSESRTDYWVLFG